MMGKDAPYVPGWDCHGLPIEFKVVQEMRRRGEKDFRPAEVRRCCAAYARKFVDLQRRRFQRLGVFGDWEAPYLTLDKGIRGGRSCGCLPNWWSRVWFIAGRSRYIGAFRAARRWRRRRWSIGIISAKVCLSSFRCLVCLGRLR